jgi:formylglycine-generating enzyme required for sulfatase activity
VVNSIGMELVWIPAGKFKMGSGTGDGDERPVHEVRISRPFYLGKYEVTQGQWQAVMDNNPSRFTGDPSLPVEQVSWEEVQEFIRKLNAREAGITYRLPTEAEWEYAARAGSTTAYSFGNDVTLLGESAWYAANAEDRTHPVGQKRPNAWELYDMHGNVWEWVQDWYGRYPAKAVTDPRGPATGSRRVFRGGGWVYFADGCRSASRGRSLPNNHVGDVGFRLLRTTEK